MKNKKVLFALIMVFVGAVIFFAGVKWEAKNKYAAQQQKSGNQQAKSISIITGQIVAKDGENISVKTKDGSLQTLKINPQVSVNKVITGNLDDLTLGEQVSVRSEENQDSTLDVKNIQIRIADKEVK